jgi:hypothetical protein
MIRLFQISIKHVYMKAFFLLLFLFLGGIRPIGVRDFIDPTGTYLLKGEVKNGQIIGHSGELRVRLLNVHTVAMCLYLDKGYPGHESGSLLDTLLYEDNRFIYIPTNDSSCAVYFAFDVKTVEISQSMTDLRAGCGFRPGVLVPSRFEKVSSEIPIIQDLSKRDVL